MQPVSVAPGIQVGPAFVERHSRQIFELNKNPESSVIFLCCSNIAVSRQSSGEESVHECHRCSG